MYFTKNAIIYSYTLIIILIGLSWFKYCRTPREITFTAEDINDALRNIRNLEKYNLCFLSGPKGDDSSRKVVKGLNEAFTKDLQAHDKWTVCKNGDETKTGFADINIVTSCGKENSIRLMFAQGIDVILSIDCSEDITSKSSPILKEIKRIIRRITDAASTTKHHQSFTNLSSFEVYLYGDAAGNQELKQQYTSIVQKAFHAIKLPSEQARISFKEFELDYIFPNRSQNNSTQKVYDREELQILKNKYNYNYDLYYNYPVNSIQSFLWVDNSSESYRFDDDGEIFDFVQIGDSYFIGGDAKLLRLKIIKIVSNYFGFNQLDKISDICKEIKCQFQEEGVFAFARQKLLQENLIKIANDLPKIKHTLNEDEFVVEKEYNNAINEALSICANQERSKLSVEITQDVIRRLRYISEEKSGRSTAIDTFPSDYLIGVYVPLLIPLIAPVLRTLFLRVKSRQIFKAPKKYV